jgi:hypothetical protein
MLWKQELQEGQLERLQVCVGFSLPSCRGFHVEQSIWDTHARVFSVWGKRISGNLLVVSEHCSPAMKSLHSGTHPHFAVPLVFPNQ